MEKTTETSEKNFTSTRNACKVCTPLGASIVFKGVEGCVPLIHGSQGCATYIRRYLISHYKFVCAYQIYLTILPLFHYQ